jgi:hypothetical protein
VFEDKILAELDRGDGDRDRFIWSRSFLESLDPSNLAARE